jgi:glycosyltransferase involved in cell wall biosynthesis
LSNEISVLLPAHGNCPYLRFTLESISRSDLQPLEILLIDDGMDEAAKNLVEKYFTNLPIRLINNSGKGLVTALNTGLDLALGKYIARIDSDDLMKPERLRLQYEFLENNPEIIVVGSNCEYINSQGKVTGISNYPIGELNKSRDFQIKCLIAHPSTMYRLSAAIKIGGYRSVFTWNNMDIAEDFDFWLRMSKIGKLHNLSNILISYRQHLGQISSTNTYGQLLGSLYVSSINKFDSKNVVKIQFIDGKSKEFFIFIRTILSIGGIKMAKHAFLRLYQFRISRKSFMSATQIKLINYLCRNSN